MYTSFFGLNEKPFSITPDPRYLFMSEQHGEALRREGQKYRVVISQLAGKRS